MNMNAMSMIKSMRDAHVVLVGDVGRLFPDEASALSYLVGNLYPKVLKEYQNNFTKKEEVDGHLRYYYGKYYVKLSEFLSGMNREEMIYALVSLMLEKMEDNCLQADAGNEN